MLVGDVCGDKDKIFRNCCILEHDRLGGPSTFLCGMGCLMTGLQTCKSYRMPDVRYRDEIPRRFFLFSISLWIIMPATSCLWRDPVHLAGSH